MKKISFGLVLSLSIAGFLLILSPSPYYNLIELKLYDVLMTLRTPLAQDNRIVFVEMDDAAIDTLGRWPWPRDILADIVNTLSSLGARQIVFDVTFAQPAPLVVRKEAAGNIFAGEDQIDAYLAEGIGIAQTQETVPGQDVAFTLEQVREGFKEFASAGKARLAASLKDTDRLLADALSQSSSFIGYNFQVVTDKADENTFLSYQKIQKEYDAQLQKKPDLKFSDLPPASQRGLTLPAKDLEDAFLRAHIRRLIKSNITIRLAEVAAALDLPASRLHLLFNTEKKALLKQQLSTFLTSNPSGQLGDALAGFSSLDDETKKFISEIWPEARNEFICASRFGFPIPEDRSFLTTVTITPPHELFTTAVTGGGFINGVPDHDGVLRRVPLFVRYNDRIFPHIGLQAIQELYRPKSVSFAQPGFVTLQNASVNGRTQNIPIPVNENEEMLINWAGRWIDTFQHVSIAEIYRLFYLRNLSSATSPSSISSDNVGRLKAKEAELKRMISGKICLIGLTAAGTHDYNPIPYESAYPMLGTHGNVLNSFLTNQFLRELSRQANVLILLACALIIGLCLPFLSSMRGLIFTCAYLLLTFLLSLSLFDRGIVINSAAPLLLGIFSYLGITSYKFATEEKAKRQIRSAFAKYVSPEVIEDILRDPSKLQLGGVRCNLTVLFSDIRGFTSYSEKRKPEDVVAILNEYLDAMTRIIVAHQGTLDKYVGDEIMAVWGAPRYEPPEASARKAVTAAVKMLERLDELRHEWARKGLEPLDIGIGINSGEMVVGNMGSELRMDYTVIGDAVNLGARVEAQTRNFNTRLIITSFTYELVKDIVIATPLEAIKVKGKDIPVMLFSVSGLKDRREPERI